jgi:hypothetical protein
MTDEQLEILKGILRGAQTAYCDRARHHEEVILEKFKQELRKDIWLHYIDKFTDQGVLDAVNRSLD